MSSFARRWTFCKRRAVFEASGSPAARASVQRFGGFRQHRIKVPQRGIESFLGRFDDWITTDFRLAVDDLTAAFSGVGEDADIMPDPVPGRLRTGWPSKTPDLSGEPVLLDFITCAEP
jgi:hypothetical protein